MCLSEDRVYVMLTGERLKTAKVKLYPNDVLMVLEEGCYDYVKVADCPVRTMWLKAYSDWVAEKEIFDV
jgi:hypothetical protein